MATYVNDLRLKEIATGDESGTWGTSTNTNLELIGNAMGVGAEAIANASTHTITMADGVADEFRSTFLRLTGGGTACTVTLAPNTLSHTWIMRNETAAALTLTQGSGANVIIAAGQTKIVATDGGGAGAIVYEMDDLELAGNLLVGGTLGVTGVLTATSLDISGDVDVDGTLETDALSINGTTVTSTAAELNILDGVTATAAELNYVDGVTSAIQTQIDAKAPIANPTFTGSFTSPGIDDNASSTAITIDSSGNITPGADNAQDLGATGTRYKDLHMSGIGFFGLYGTGVNDGNLAVGEGIYVGAISSANQIRSSSEGGSSTTLYIGNAAIQVSSDQRLKTNIVDTEMDALEKVNQVRVVDFNWDDPSDTSFNNRNARGKWTGVLAQELVDIFSFAVNAPRNESDLSIDTDSEQRWLVDQAQMVPVLIKAIQQLSARVAELEEG